MSFLKFSNIHIEGVSAVVPKTIVSNYDLKDKFNINDIENTIKTTGILNRRFADKDVCSSDLCYQAAENLMSDMNIDKKSIDMLIFLSQTPDYKIPATAPSLQHRLGLKKNCASFDINLACSGYIYGLSTAYLYASQTNIDRVLLLVGETLSKNVSPRDRSTSMLFGDGGTATLIRKSKALSDSFFSLNSDGSGQDVLKIKAGGYRYPSSIESLKVNVYDNESQRTDEQLYMDGMEVFNFTMREVPKDIKRLLKFSEYNIQDIDYIFFHQANKFMTDFFAKKLKYPIDKVPYSISDYGNTSAVSIPLTIASQMGSEIRNKRILLSGYGAGLSWGTSIHNISKMFISKVVEYEK